MLFQQQFLTAPTSPPPVVYRSVSTGTSATVTKPSGIDVGDIVFVAVNQPNTTTSLTSASGAWAVISFSNGLGGGLAYAIRVYWKVLVLADLSGNWTLDTSAPFQAVAYQGRGATTATARETKQSSTGSLTFSGFAPSAGTRGVVHPMINGTSGTTFSAPSGFTIRDQGAYGSGPTLRHVFSDKTDYGGLGLTWTGAQSSDPGAFGSLIEIT